MYGKQFEQLGMKNFVNIEMLVKFAGLNENKKVL